MNGYDGEREFFKDWMENKSQAGTVAKTFLLAIFYGSGFCLFVMGNGSRMDTIGNRDPDYYNGFKRMD